MSCFYDHVVHICLYCFADLFFQACLNHALIGCAGILKPERHIVEAKRAIWRYKSCCSLVRLCHLYLMVSRVCVEKTQRVVSNCGIYDLIDVREGKGILGASLVEVFEVDA